MFLVGATLKRGSSSEKYTVIIEYVNSHTCSSRLHHCTAARDHSPLTKKVALLGNGSRWDCIFSRTIIIFVGPDVFLAGRSAYLIFMDEFFFFLGNH